MTATEPSADAQNALNWIFGQRVDSAALDSLPFLSAAHAVHMKSVSPGDWNAAVRNLIQSTVWHGERRPFAGWTIREVDDEIRLEALVIDHEKPQARAAA